MAKFVKPQSVSQSILDNILAAIDFNEAELQCGSDQLYFGLITHCDLLFSTAQTFIVTIYVYLLCRCPDDLKLLKYTNWLVFKNKMNHSFENLEQFDIGFQHI